MFYMISFTIFMLNVIVSFAKRHSKILAFMLLILSFVYMAATNNSDGMNGDYWAYSQLYNHFISGGDISNISGYSTDFGYMVLMILVSKLNVSYNIFVLFLSVVSFLLIFSTISKISNNYNVPLVLYTIFPFFYDVIQFRYFFAYSIIVYALQFIVFEEKRSYVKYFILVIISALFHITTLYFLIYLLLKFNLTKVLKLFGAFSILLTAVLFFGKINVVELIYRIIPLEKVGKYATIGYKLNPLTSIAVMLLILYLVYIVKYINAKRPCSTNNIIFSLNLLSLVIVPFLLVSLDFERFFRPLLLVNYALIAKESNNLSKYKKIILLITVVAVLLVRLFMMRSHMFMVIKNNYIYEMFL